jgi:hypothetical protein
MMILFGGIPDIYYERLRERALIELAEHKFTGVPLRASAAGRYAINRQYCEELIRTLVAFIQGRPSCLERGLGVVLILRAWEQNRFESLFLPFALCKSVAINVSIRTSGEGAKRSANGYASHALSAAKRLSKPLAAMTSEFETRLRRTPLLLPIRHFASEHLIALVVDTLRGMNDSSNPSEKIRELCNRFETFHPYRKGGRRQGYFSSRAGVDFVAPGRQIFHGTRVQGIPEGHNEGCYLNARVRLGGFYSDGGFHYDCTRAGASHAGTFKNCHDAEAAYVGRPHLNVYPNDFIRP